MKKLLGWVVVWLLVWALVGCAPVGPTVSPVVTPGISPVATPGGAAAVVPGDSGDIPQVELSGTGIAAIVAVLSSIAMAYIPGADVWWKTFPNKRLAIGLVGLIVACLLVVLHYAGAVDLGLGVFGWPVIWKLIEVWLAYSGAGQLAFTAQHAGKK